MELVEVVLLLIIGLAIGLIPVVSLVFPRTKKNLSTQHGDRYGATFETRKSSHRQVQKMQSEKRIEAAKKEAVEGSIGKKEE